MSNDGLLEEQLAATPTAPEALTGVVTPDIYTERGRPDEDEERIYDSTMLVLRRAAEVVKTRIDEKVRERAAVNDEIKTLRDEDERLTSMMRIASRKGTKR